MVRFKLRQGDCLEIMPIIKENGADAIICDPPYGLSFMGREWDHGVPGTPFWKEALRVAKPGAHLLAFGGTRTHHRLMVAIEDAGWEIRDCLMWLYGSGMPKGQDISKAIDKMAGAEREVVGHGKGRTGNAVENHLDIHGDDAYVWPGNFTVTTPTTEAAKQWDGWNTSLKPAWEPVILARKPISEKTIAANVLKWGTGAINIDASRIDADSRPLRILDAKATQNNVYAGRMNDSLMGGSKAIGSTDLGRWPANLILDEETGAMLDGQTGVLKSGKPLNRLHKDIDGRNTYGSYEGGEYLHTGYGDSGGASRFFYCSKASKSDRGEGNDHPTVKPTSLMRYLCKLVTPPNGVILDPFMGSGSTGKAALLEGFLFYGIELDEHSFDIASERVQKTYEELEHATPNSR